MAEPDRLRSDEHVARRAPAETRSDPNGRTGARAAGRRVGTDRRQRATVAHRARRPIRSRKPRSASCIRVRGSNFAKGLRSSGSPRCRRRIARAKQRTLAAGDYLADHFGEAPAIAVFCFNPKFMAITDAKLDRVSVVGGGSIYTAVQNLMLACRAEGLGCVLTTLLCEHEEKVREILAIPQPWGTAAAIPMGYPIAKGHGPIRRQSPSQLVYANRWGTSLE